MVEKEPDFLNDLDAIILHVGTNNIADARSSESITDELRDAVYAIKSANENVKIIVSSILPRNNDKLVNEKILKINKSLQTMCQEKGHYFLDNYQNFIYRGSVNAALYRDSIHLNAKGGKVLGTSMRTALNNVLNIGQSESMMEHGPSFHNGRYSGRRTLNNRNMVFMPVPQYMLDNQNPWYVPNQYWY